MRAARKPDAKEMAARLLSRYGTTFAEELGLDLASGDRSALFCWFLAALLFSTRISHSIALRSARVLLARGWTTPEKLARTTWQERATALDEGGYVRYDERTSTRLGEAAGMLIERYGGELRNLRQAAGRDPARERELLKEFKGIGEVAVNIFFREAQLAWPELFPFADERTLAEAKALGLPATADALRTLVRNRRDYVRLVSALVRVRLEHREDEVQQLSAA
jgi:endonuclease III